MKTIRINYEQLVYIIKCECIIVLKQYFGIHKSKVVITLEEYKKIADFFIKNFKYKLLKKKKGVGEFVKECAKILKDKFGESYSIFTTNLIIKRLVPVMPKKIIKYLDAPLNDKEILLVSNCPIKSVRNLSFGNYNSVMNSVRKDARKQNLSLYEWELFEYNKQ